MGNVLTEYERLSLKTSDEGLRYRFALAFPNGQVLYAVMTNELAIGGGNQFSSHGAVLREIPIVGKALQLKDKVNPVLKESGRSAFSRGESNLVWEESHKPTFSLEFTLLALTNAESKLNAEKIQLIGSAVLPIGEGSQGLIAPLGYNTSGAGTLSLAVGTWFNAKGLIVSASSCTPSRQVMKDGYPLFWTCSMTLEPRRVVTIDEFKRYFQKVQVLDTDQVAQAKKDDPNLFDRFVAKVNDVKKNLLG